MRVFSRLSLMVVVRRSILRLVDKELRALQRIRRRDIRLANNHFVFCVLIILIQNHLKVWNSLVLCLLERFELAADKELQVIEGICKDPHYILIN